VVFASGDRNHIGERPTRRKPDLHGTVVARAIPVHPAREKAGCAVSPRPNCPVRPECDRVLAASRDRDNIGERHARKNFDLYWPTAVRVRPIPKLAKDVPSPCPNCPVRPERDRVAISTSSDGTHIGERRAGGNFGPHWLTAVRVRPVPKLATIVASPPPNRAVTFQRHCVTAASGNERHGAGRIRDTGLH